LEEFLKDEACGENQFASVDSLNERLYFTRRGRWVAPERKRPDTSIDE
jgi:hypothetical protein